jgi:hypothetical protein
MHQIYPGRIDTLISKRDLSLDDTRHDSKPRYPAVCACSDEPGAAYYAWRHNRTAQDDTPIIIEFEAQEGDVAVDSRDFLATVFQLGDPKLARYPLEQAFGPKILRYAEMAWSSDNQESRIALCDLAIHDPEVVRGHHANKPVIAGRHGTVFRSAFTVKLPVDGAAIRKVWTPERQSEMPSADIVLSDVLATNRA